MKKIFLLLLLIPLFLACSSDGGNDNAEIAGTTWKCDVTYDKPNMTVREIITFEFSSQTTCRRIYTLIETVIVEGIPVSESTGSIDYGKYTLDLDSEKLIVDFEGDDSHSEYRYVYIYTGSKFYTNESYVQYDFYKQ